jgi:hypothetical protein
MAGKIVYAVIRQIDECGIIDAMRDRTCGVGTVSHLDRLYREGKLTLEPVYGWGEMTHGVTHGGHYYHVKVEE